MQRYVDVSRQNNPYRGGVFDAPYMAGLGEATPAAVAPATEPTAPAPIPQANEPTAPVAIPEQTIYGQCDFTKGTYVDAIQAYLVKQGAMTQADVTADNGFFGDRTCAAWQKHFGVPPDVPSMEAALLNPNERCGSFLVPPCSVEASAGHAGSISTGKMLLWGIGLVGLGVIASRWLR